MSKKEKEKEKKRVAGYAKGDNPFEIGSLTPSLSMQGGILRNESHHLSKGREEKGAYFPNFVLFLTLILPRLSSWLLGPGGLKVSPANQ